MAESNNFVKINTNTNSLFLNGKDDLLLKVSLYDENISLSFMYPQPDASGRNKYPKEKRVNLLLSSDRVAALSDIITSGFTPALVEGKNYNGGVFTNRDKTSIFEIACVDGKCELRYHTGIGANRLPAHSTIFRFVDVQIVEGYNPKTGDYSIADVQSGMYLFIKLIDAFTYAVSNSYAHADRYANVYSNERIMNYLIQIATALGVNPNMTNNATTTVNWDTSEAKGPSGAMPAIIEMDNEGLENMLS